MRTTLENNESSGGAMSRADPGPADLKRLSLACKQEFSAISAAGQHPWVASMRRWAVRSGAGAFPLPGVGSSVWIESPGSVTLQLFKASGFVDQGLIVLGDLPGFLESPSGRTTLVGDNWLLVDLRHARMNKNRTFVWIPYGYLAWPLYMPSVSEEPVSATQQAAVVPSLTFVVALSVFSPALVAALPPSTWAAIEQHNRTYMDKQVGSTLWATRAQALATFSAGVARESS